MNMIIKADDAQFKLSDAGEILFQEKVGSPLPGVAIAVLGKGETPLAPKILTAEGHDGLAERLDSWLGAHIQNVLADLWQLQTREGLPDPVGEICARMFAAMGVMHRSDLEDVIKDLTPESRGDLRGKKIRLGPLLAFMPEMNKPAAVRLKAVLWSLYHDEVLPAPCPKDGVVSFGIDPENVNRAFYQVVGYPVFGPRSIRIDMLDRVVNAVYDAAAEGKFQAQHQMAEWLGCSIEDLYAILRAMGHKQIKSEAEEVSKKTEEGKETLEDGAAAPPEEKKPDVKPALDWFWIKKGRASEKPQRKKPVHKAKPHKQKDPKKKIKGERKKKEPKKYEFEAEKKLEDSPFAILGQLKK